MTSLYSSKKDRTFGKNLYERKKERKYKYEMTNAVTYDLYELVGLTV
jgi:hypothetical protein